MKVTVKFFIFSFIFLLVSCIKEQPTQSINHTPEIQSITSNPSTSSSNRLQAGGTITLTVTATDPDKDQLGYIWECTGGAFIEGQNTSTAKWQSTITGTLAHYIITVNVSDGIKIAKETITVYVASAEKSVTLEGHIYHYGTTIPVSGVHASVGAISDTTGLDGFYFLTGIPYYGNKILKAEKEGYDPFQKTVVFWLETTKTEDIPMTSSVYTHTLYGTIISLDPQEPLQDVRVTIVNDDGTASQLTGISDAGGNYQISAVPEGQRKVSFKRLKYLTDISEIYMGHSDYQFNVSLESASVMDIDGNTYVTVEIGDQWWIAENLKVTHYRNGDPIPNVTDGKEWGRQNTGQYCNFDNNESNGEIYGRLYNWYAVSDSRNLAPEGWHVPTDAEWKKLEMELGMTLAQANVLSGLRGSDQGTKMKSTSGWMLDKSTNESGFNALPGGDRHYRPEYGDGFSCTGYYAYFWTSSGQRTRAFYRYLWSGEPKVGRSLFYTTAGFSVRCVRDDQ